MQRRMKYFKLLLLIVAINCNAQDYELDKKQLNALHNRTKFVRDSIGKLIKNNNERVVKNAELKEKLLLKIDSLWNISDQNDIEELKINIQYSKNNPNSIYSFSLVQQQVARQPGKDFYSDFEYIYLHSSQEIKDSEIGIKMAEQLKYFKQSMVGSMSVNIEGVDYINNPFSLHHFKGKKYILIDFWASWCAPCREEIPFLKMIYDKYKNQDFEIVSISIDDDLDKWRNAIKKENIEEWSNYSTVQNNSSAKKDYFVNGIPHKILIDKNGKIIGKWKASGELNKKSIENQLVELFK